jgi:putative spermidine/putrescine transport system ATP-binding protein
MPTGQVGQQDAPRVRFRDVVKTYDGITAVVKRLDLDVAAGEFLTLLGPSGSGKTTTLMMLAGFEVPTSGTIAVDGKPVNSLPPHRRDIGMVFQNYALFPHMTVAENVAFPLSVRKVPRAEQEARVGKALGMVKLGALGGRRPAQLSGGQQQRVALARALVFAPRIVLMDEPLGALDKNLREHMQLEIKHLHEELGLTVVYVTHDQSEALTMSDRIAVFNDGVIQQLDAPDAIYGRPSNSFVANFIGENNALPGIVEQLEQGYALVRLATGEMLWTSAVAVDRIGQRTALGIRPERIVIGAEGLQGRVLEHIYHGDHVRLRVAAGGSDQVMVKLRYGEGEVPAPGADVSLGVAPEHCLALDAPQ